MPQLPDAAAPLGGQAERVRGTLHPVPAALAGAAARARGCGVSEPWPDEVHDSIALVCAEVTEDLVGAGAILRNGDHKAMTVVLSKMLSEIVKEQDVSLPHFRLWAESCVDRP